MAIIVIRDLSENVALDHAAMRAIAGGARWRSAPAAIGAPQRGKRIINDPVGTVRKPERQESPARS